MNSRIPDRTPPATAAVVTMNAPATGSASHEDLKRSHADWPVREPSLNILHRFESTVGFIRRSPVVEEKSAAEDFGSRIGAVYASLLDGQEPLDAECAAVWDQNTDQLYEC